MLRLQADLRWLEACARYWNRAKGAMIGRSWPTGPLAPAGCARNTARGAALVARVDESSLDVAHGESVAIDGAERLRQVDPAATCWADWSARRPATI